MPLIVKFISLTLYKNGFIHNQEFGKIVYINGVYVFKAYLVPSLVCIYFGLCHNISLLVLSPLSLSLSLSSHLFSLSRYLGMKSRIEAEYCLQKMWDGVFLIRESKDRPGEYAVALKSVSSSSFLFAAVFVLFLSLLVSLCLWLSSLFLFLFLSLSLSLSLSLCFSHYPSVSQLQVESNA